MAPKWYDVSAVFMPRLGRQAKDTHPEILIFDRQMRVVKLMVFPLRYVTNNFRTDTEALGIHPTVHLNAF